MKVKLFLSTAVMVVTLLWSCTRGSEYKQTENGLEYKFFRKTESVQKPKVGDVIQMRFRIYFEDSLLDSSDALWGAVDMRVSESKFKGGVEEALMMMSEGDSAHFLIDAHKFYINNKNSSAPDFIKIGDKLRFEIGLAKIFSDNELEAKAMNEKQKAQLKEHQLFIAYMAAEFPDITIDSSDYYIIKRNENKGTQAQPGKTALVHYTGKFLDGRVFDTTIGNAPFEFRIGANKVIEAWEIAILQMRKNEKITLICKSSLAYKDTGFGKIIPPYTSLVFEIELLEIN